jgi:hypothetical protein
MRTQPTGSTAAAAIDGIQGADPKRLAELPLDDVERLVDLQPEGRARPRPWMLWYGSCSTI